MNEKLVFNRLRYAVQREICELMIQREVERLKRLGHNIFVKSDTLEHLVGEGFHRTLGARPMRNTVDRYRFQQAGRIGLAIWLHVGKLSGEGTYKYLVFTTQSLGSKFANESFRPARHVECSS